MFGLIKELVTLIVSISIIGYGSTWGLKTAYYKVRDLALTRVSKGLSPMTPFNEQLTCLKLDEKYNSHRIMTGHCGRHWRKVDRASKRRRENRDL